MYMVYTGTSLPLSVLKNLLEKVGETMRIWKKDTGRKTQYNVPCTSNCSTKHPLNVCAGVTYKQAGHFRQSGVRQPGHFLQRMALFSLMAPFATNDNHLQKKTYLSGHAAAKRIS